MRIEMDSNSDVLGQIQIRMGGVRVKFGRIEIGQFDFFRKNQIGSGQIIY
jgi:hypothetical protein